MDLTPDQTIYWEYGFIRINQTLVTTWAIIAGLALLAWLVTRRFDRSKKRSRWQNLLEMIVLQIQSQIEAVGLSNSALYLPFLGSLLIFIAVSALLTIVPGYVPPTGSLSTTTALAVCVFVAVPYYGIREIGLVDYLKAYIKPTPIMLPFNLISEFSRTLALAVRLFGNMMSGAMIIGILLSIAPLIIPILMTALGLITGAVQSYIFFILTAVYIAAATQAHEQIRKKRLENHENSQ